MCKRRAHDEAGNPVAFPIWFPGRSRRLAIRSPVPKIPSILDLDTVQPAFHDTRTAKVLILPAIDLRGGQCVRLRQGDYAQETVFGRDPAAMARRWVEAGATFLHLVDLDGARAGRPVNGESVRRVVAKAGVPCQLGGGLRTEADIEEA